MWCSPQNVHKAFMSFLTKRTNYILNNSLRISNINNCKYDKIVYLLKDGKIIKTELPEPQNKKSNQSFHQTTKYREYYLSRT